MALEKLKDIKWNRDTVNEIIDVLRASMMQSILIAVTERNEAVRNYLMAGLTAITRKIPRTCTSIAYKK